MCCRWRCVTVYWKTLEIIRDEGLFVHWQPSLWTSSQTLGSPGALWIKFQRLSTKLFHPRDIQSYSEVRSATRNYNNKRFIHCLSPWEISGHKQQQQNTDCAIFMHYQDRQLWLLVRVCFRSRRASLSNNSTFQCIFITLQSLTRPIKALSRIPKAICRAKSTSKYVKFRVVCAPYHRHSPFANH